jgi:hypothetical protein
MGLADRTVNGMDSPLLLILTTLALVLLVAIMIVLFVG